ncbi:MAG: HNH endonuclease [Oscillospiraceae bacterium]|nr:HNH endonuclease [Oscillospiraceae bacterium]
MCPNKPKKFKNKTKKDKFRSTIVWQKKRNTIAERDLWLCRICLEQGHLNSDSLQVHHITPLADDYSLRLEDSNLITLCPFHHEQAECGQISAEHLRELAGTPPVPEDNSDKAF